MSTDVQRAVAALVAERPEWVPILEAAVAVSDRTEQYGGEVCGAWVIDELERREGHKIWLPNLRVLQSYGLLEKSGESVRGGRRAYYRFASKQDVVEALSRLKPHRPGDGPKPPRRRFAFIGAGDSGEPGSDWARRSSDLPFEPTTWRSS